MTRKSLSNRIRDHDVSTFTALTAKSLKAKLAAWIIGIVLKRDNPLTIVGD